MTVVIDHDTWAYSPAKLPKASAITLPEIHGVLPFDGVRNPSARSSVSHKVHIAYRTEANNWQPKVGIGESAAEIAVAHEALVSPQLYDLHFQPMTVRYRDDDGVERSYTHDLLMTTRDGRRRLVFVRNHVSLKKPKTVRAIKAIHAATPKSTANDMIVVDAQDYTRQRRDNLFRMHNFVFRPDPEADEITLNTARRLKTLRLMKDLFPRVPLAQPRVFAACYRLVAARKLHANLDHVLWENSRIEVRS
ncbi:hypothetical protein D3P06_05035 [Paracoccus aestuarii]|uniref:TnsA endonuclease N-terminal domain-containing protein n=1 Tax=Paracoccus aestuarii TaxID=453842 RepID=A0A418ZZU0_9RHOB|nr:hypothetical protein [Paracoccus aestuarii]RJL06027.1 hypothetical protein D3P06_05035 [Paracoccus aestuarii]WCQ99114.1 hypothetical protein JHW48_14955 [Paracoccus aestuarii]